MKLNNFFKLIITVVISELAGLIGAVFTTPSISTWYATLPKPALNPPAWVFAPVWTILFALIGIALFLVWKQDWKVVNPLWEKGRKAWNPWSERLWTGDLQRFNTIAVFAVQYLLNIFWSYVFFGLHRPGAAFFVIIALWTGILYTMINFYRISKLAAWLLVPYILWVSFAGYLNYSIWQLAPAAPQTMYCTQEAKLCPDGSYVGRSGPMCEFAACPSPVTLAVLSATIGQKVSGLGVTLTPLALLEDSRCPADVQCIWAGIVKVQVKIQSGAGESIMIFELDKPVTGSAEQIILAEVLPQPKGGVKIKDNEYIFHFEITKRPEAPAATSGITGYIHMGPTCPVERIPPDPSCADKPYANASLVATNAEGRQYKDQTDADGQFRLMVPLGRYTIKVSPINILPRCEEKQVEVTTKQLASVDISCDTGIR
ncbi:MAG: hypothetical protein A2722_04055 [Candidatus Doudnabacteria bacterium RIFCSPHIGHO2_01_FULL_50_11]|uniref:Carboxypeptidase regulatory-like domain-containing protein n=1 Tax=Candidatus Doudnabacteria bacterium RIFCSPHIGHO2_01_FULL_50_11 TaxID=1817828 RepID=A0A1F5PG68_9BACT|nr:MAG: hypothetical protein A2722_04055 [Candidatus Doudnabacteria bacterium RIFCSPHIGHO2_01_FULL_50_11]